MCPFSNFFFLLSILMKTHTLKTKYFPKSFIWMRVETRLQSQQKSNGSQERYVCAGILLILTSKSAWVGYLNKLIPLHLNRTWPSAQARHRIKLEGRGNMKNQRASSPGSLIMLMLELMSLVRSSRMTSGQTPCSTTWYVYPQTLISSWKDLVCAVGLFLGCWLNKKGV